LPDAAGAARRDGAPTRPALDAATVEATPTRATDAEPAWKARPRPPTRPSPPPSLPPAPEPAEASTDLRRPGSFPSGHAELKPLAAAPTEATRSAQARPSTFGEVDDEIDAIDAVDLELFPIFEEEAQELLPKLDGQLRDWLREPTATAHAAACMRTLHTLKGGARLAGAMRLGEMAHRLETRIERLTGADGQASTEDVESLQAVSER
jgi:chemosensory pili system protein ChpA (sensor histidine kinase/response regulator)